MVWIVSRLRRGVTVFLTLPLSSYAVCQRVWSAWSRMRVENTPEDVTDFPLAITSSGVYDEVHDPPSPPLLCTLIAPCSWIKYKSWKLTNQKQDRTQRRNSNELDR